MQIGWILKQGKNNASGQAAFTKSKLNFSLSETFKRAFDLVHREKSLDIVSKDVATEELNFSEAAIRFSSDLTIQNFTTCFRCIVQVMGGLMQSKNNTLSIDFGVGSMICGSGEVSFRFNETFAEDHADSARSELISRLQRSSSAHSDIRLRDSISSASLNTSPSPETSLLAKSSAYRTLSSLSAKNRSKQEIVYSEAFSRHLSQIEARARDALHDNKLREERLAATKTEEKLESSRRREQWKIYRNHLSKQIIENDHKRKQERQNFIESASCHDFPRFTAPESTKLAAFKRHNAQKIQSALDSQIKERAEQRCLLRQKEVALSNQFNAENQIHMRAENVKELNDRAKQQRILKASWDTYSKLNRRLRKIESFDS